MNKEIEVTATGYVARDDDDSLYLYSTEPFKAMDMWVGDDIVELNKEDFINVKANDELPLKVELKIKIIVPSIGD